MRLLEPCGKGGECLTGRFVIAVMHNLHHYFNRAGKDSFVLSGP